MTSLLPYCVLLLPVLAPLALGLGAPSAPSPGAHAFLHAVSKPSAPGPPPDAGPDQDLAEAPCLDAPPLRLHRLRYIEPGDAEPGFAPRAARARLQPYAPLRPAPPRPLHLSSDLQPPGVGPYAYAPVYASPRSDDEPYDPYEQADRVDRSDRRRGYYGHEVGYGSYFPIGLDPLTILAGLAFLAFIIQTLYLLLYKHYGLGLGGLGVGAGAGVGIGPLSADRHQRDEQQAWANAIASRIDSTASLYANGSHNDTDFSHSGQDAEGQEVATVAADGEGATTDAVLGPELPELERTDDARQVRRRQLGFSPLDAIIAMVRSSWNAPARNCGPSWLCKLLYFARMLAAPLTKSTAPAKPPGTLWGPGLGPGLARAAANEPSGPGGASAPATASATAHART